MINALLSIQVIMVTDHDCIASEHEDGLSMDSAMPILRMRMIIENKLIIPRG